MRTTFTKTLTEAESDQLLTTGEAARILGTSRQHVVDLCNMGSLPFRSVGRHRRVRMRDVEALRTGTSRLTRDQLRSLWLSHAVAARIVQDPVAALEKGRANLRRMQASSPRGAAKVWLDQWSHLLDGPVEDVLAALTSRSPRSRELRQNSPFAGVLTDDQRRAILRNFALAHHEEQAP
jgi:excisionase family DNA binding protein